MDLLLKPRTLDADYTSSTGAEEWQYFKTTLDNFIKRLEKKAAAADPIETVDKLEILTVLLSPSIHKHVAQCTTYEEAIKELTNLYIKKPNEIFARHQLATRKQQPGETLDDYFQALKVLSKDCNFKNVTAEQNTADSIRGSFIDGLSSHLIRTRLLEYETLTLQEAFDRARALDSAQKHSETYGYHPNSVSASAVLPNSSSEESSQAHVMAAGTYRPSAYQSSSQSYKSSKSCFFCGGPPHPRWKCPAKDNDCAKCGKKGHFPKVCQSRQYSHRPTNASIVVEEKTRPTMYSIAPKSSFSKGVIATSSVDKVPAVTLADSGANITCVDSDFVARGGFKVHTSHAVVELASSHTATSSGFIIADLTFQGHTYKQTKITVLPNLVSELVLGTDLMKQHSRVQLEFGGERSPLIISSLNPIRVTVPTLFKNLTSNCHPIAVKSRRYSFADQKFIDQEVKRLLNDDIIEPCNSPWRAQLLVHRSENHKDRLVVDYSRTINQFTELDAYPAAVVTDVVQEMAQYQVSTELDLRSAYHQFELLDSDRPYTAFQAGRRLYQFKRVPFGLRNSGAVVQRILDGIIEKNNLQGVTIYCDNIYIGGKDQQEHDQRVKAFLGVAAKMNITFNEGKSVYSTDTLSILGTQICKGVMRPDPERVRPLMELPDPEDMPQLKRVIGMFAHYSQWIPKFSQHVQPLVQVVSFPLSKTAKISLNILKTLLSEATLQPIAEGVPFTVETDASNFAIGATLSQNGKPVAFHSRTLQGSERRHSAVEKEAYSIVEALRKWHHFLEGQHFTLVTDQKSVAFMFDIKHQSKIKNEKILRWRIELSSLMYDIIYRPGMENVVPDMLSRTVCSMNTSSLKELHDLLCHPGVTRLNHYVKTKNLPYELSDIRSATSNCRICSEIKPNFFKPQGGKLIKSTQPWERLNIDFKGPLPSRGKNKYILTVVDEFSRYPFAFPCSNMKSSTVIDCLITIFSIFGMPAYIHSDKGSNLISAELRTFFHSRGIAASNTTPYHPQGNGQCERYNGVIWKTVQLALRSKGLSINCWEDVLTDALHSIRSLLCTSTNCTPHERMFHHPRRSTLGVSLPGWLCEPGPVLLRNFKRASKYEPLVSEVELVHANPNYALVRFPCGRESNVSLKDLAPAGDTTTTQSDTEPPRLDTNVNVFPNTNSENTNLNILPDSNEW